MVAAVVVVSVSAVHTASAASVRHWASYLAAPVTASHVRENTPSARLTVSPVGTGGGSSATSVTVTVTVAVSVPPRSSLASTVSLYSSVVS